MIIFIWIGGPAICITLFIGFYQIWLNNQQGKWKSSVKFILLAIDIPRLNQQSPRAVENMFSYLAGAHGTLNLIEQYLEGKFQLVFSYEIVSIDGYTQFLVHLPEKFKNLVETSIYSQYPDAEITEVEDYTKGMPRKFPDDTWDIWGSEFIYAKNAAFPIRTYESFEHQSGPSEMHYKDPMSALMDLCGSLRKGEQLWYQIIVKPVGFNEMDVSEKEIAALMKDKIENPKHLGDKFVDLFIGTLQFISNAIHSMLIEASDIEVEEEKALKMMDLRPLQKQKLEALSTKSTKLSYLTKIRMVYIAKKEVMNRAKAVNGFVGYMKQFADVQLNNLKPDTKQTATTVKYSPKINRLNRKKRKIINNFINRSGPAGRDMQMMSIDELATLWNFPQSEYIKATGLQKVSAKRAQAPSSLQFTETSDYDQISDISTDELNLIENELLTDEKLPSSIFESKTEKPISNTAKQKEEDINLNNDILEDELKTEPELKGENKKNYPKIPDNLPFE